MYNATVTYDEDLGALTVRGPGLAIRYDVDAKGNVSLDAAGDHDVTSHHEEKADVVLKAETRTLRGELDEINQEIAELQAQRARIWKKLGMIGAILDIEE